METLGEIKSYIKSEFGKTHPTLETNLEDRLTARLRELCSDYDYWFLRVDPGFKALVGIDSSNAINPSTVTYGTGRWIDQGWMITTAGTEYYPLSIASTGTPAAPATWGDAEARKIHYVKKYSLYGGYEGDVEVVGPNQFFNTPPQQGIYYAPNTALKATIQMGLDRKQYLRVSPTPQDTYLLAVSYQLALPPWIGSGDSRINWISHFYPRVLLCLAGLVYASFFHETTQMEYWKKELWGDTDNGRNRSDIANSGLVGRMRMDTEFRPGGEFEELGHYQSLTDAMGRDGYRPSRIGAPFYSG